MWLQTLFYYIEINQIKSISVPGSAPGEPTIQKNYEYPPHKVLVKLIKKYLQAEDDFRRTESEYRLKKVKRSRKEILSAIKQIETAEQDKLQTLINFDQHGTVL